MTGEIGQGGALKLAVLFPGIGYTCDKPLMYYAGKLAASLHYQVRFVPYGRFPPKVRGDREKLDRCFELAWEQTGELLGDIRWEDYAEVVLIGKSIGAAVACRWAEARGIEARRVLMTPLMETFQYPTGRAIAFHGTADPWARTPDIRSACAARDIPLFITEGGNHSLETGDPMADIEALRRTMSAVRDWLLDG